MISYRFTNEKTGTRPFDYKHKKPSILKKIEDIFKKEAGADWYDELSKHEKQSIEKGISEADKGELIPHELVMQEIKAKYGLE